MDYEVRNNLLESENQLYKSELKARLDKIKELEEENRKLKERVEELEQCNLNLQTWLDNKEKVNKSLREENRKLEYKLESLEK